MRALTKATAAALAPIPIAPNERLQLDIDKDGIRFVANFCHVPLGAADASIVVPHPAKRSSMNALCARIPERKELVEGSQWLFAGTDYTVGIIDHLWPRTQLRFTGNDALTLYQCRLLEMKQQEQRADTYAAFKTAHSVPAHDLEFRAELHLQPSPYQQVAICNSMGSDGYALFMEPGTGKTLCVIVRACNEARKRRAAWQEQVATAIAAGQPAPLWKPYRVLIVCPKNVRANWRNEFAIFGTRSGTQNVHVMRGDEIDRRRCIIEAVAAVDDDMQIIACGYEQLSNSWNFLSCVPWDLAVLDEGHYIKSADTRRWKFAKQLRDLATHRMLLTGTPITNSPLDLWSQLEFLGQGYSGFVNHKTFREFYGVYDQDESGRSVLVSVQNMPFLQERLTRLSFAITKEEALPDMPKKTYDIIEVEMTEQQKQVYNDLRSKLVVEAEGILENNDIPRMMRASNVLTKFLRLAQITSGIARWDAIFDEVTGEIITPAETVFFDPNPKLEALVEALKAHPSNEKAIIWCCFKPNIRQIASRLALENMPCVEFYGETSDAKRTEAEYLFNNDPAYRWFIGNPASGGTGLNLLGHPGGKSDTGQHATHATRVFEYSQNWSPTIRWQGEDRAHRRGAEFPVAVTDIVVAGSVDEEIRVRCMEKKTTALSVQDVQAILKAIITGVIE